MKHVYEFEVFLDEGRYTVWPLDGGRLAENRR